MPQPFLSLGASVPMAADQPAALVCARAWTARDRMAVRLAARHGVAEHRARGAVDTEPPADQHRQGALWATFGGLSDGAFGMIRLIESGEDGSWPF